MKICVAGVVGIASLGLAACNECENGFKVKTEYKYVTGNDFWFKSPRDTLLDGAVRTSTWTYKSGRSLELRCFKHRPDSPTAKLDLRYSIGAPLLKRIVPQLEKSGAIEVILSIDGSPVGTLDVKPIAHDDSISFLGDIKREFVDKLLDAKKTIVAMPRQGKEKLDDVIEFGVAELAKHILPVMRACEGASPAVPSPPTPAQSQSTKM